MSMFNKITVIESLNRLNQSKNKFLRMNTNKLIN